MQLAELTVMAKSFVENLPAEVLEGLQDIELIISDDVAKVCKLLTKELGEEFDPKELTADLKGVFVGTPMEVEETDNNDNSEEEVVYFPEGFIVLLSPNVETPEEGALVLMHEIGHALGMDEEEVKNLGLGVAKKGEDTNGVPNSSG
jgi:predicted Zn-dependent protease with MMP-like domain